MTDYKPYCECGKKAVRNGKCESCCMSERKAERKALEPPKKKKAIKPRSDKKVALDKEYSALRRVFLEEYPICQHSIGGLCNQPSVEVHHTSKSSLNYLNTETWMASCRYHHELIEFSYSAEMRRENGLLRD